MREAAADGVASTMGEFISGGSSSMSRKPVAEVNDDNRIKALHKEIEGLQGKIEKTKAKVRKMEVDSPIKGMPFSSPTAGGGGRGTAIAAAAEFSSTTKFSLDRDLGLYILSVEIQCPLDVVIVRSPVKLEVVENDMTTSLASVTPDHLLDPLSDDDTTSDPCRFIAAVRAQTGEKRTKIALRPREGDHGDITVSIVTATTPKMAKSLRFTLKPLCLHHTCHVVTDEEKARPRCSIKLTGKSISTPRLCMSIYHILLPPRAGITATGYSMIVAASEVTDITTSGALRVCGHVYRTTLQSASQHPYITPPSLPHHDYYHDYRV
jgi:hypothetical protein